MRHRRLFLCCFSVLLACILSLTSLPATPVSAESTENELQRIASLDMSNTLNFASGFVINGDYIYVWGHHSDFETREKTNRIMVIDISNYGNPTIPFSMDCENEIHKMTVHKNHLLALYESKNHDYYGIETYNISNPESPVFKNRTVLFDHTSLRMAHNEDTLYVESCGRGSFSKFKILQVSIKDPVNPEIVSSNFIDTQYGIEYSSLPQYLHYMELKDDYLFAACTDQVYVFDTSSEELQLIDVIDHNLNFNTGISATVNDADPWDYCVYLSGFQRNTFTKPGFYENGDPVKQEAWGVELTTRKLRSGFDHLDRTKCNSYAYPSDIQARGMTTRQNIAFVTGNEDRETEDIITGYIQLVDFKDPENPVLLHEYKEKGFIPRLIKESDDYLFIFGFMNEFHIFKLPDIDYGFEPSIE